MQWLIPYNFKDTTLAISPCNSADRNIYISTSTHIIAFLNLHVVEVQSATSWLPLLKFGIKPRTERKGPEPEVIVADVTRSRNLALHVRTPIARSETATKTGQASAESHVNYMKLLR